MYHIVNTEKSFEQSVKDLQSAVIEHKFGLLHIHDLGETLRSKGFDFAPKVQVFEVCQPAQAFKVLNTDLKINMALPCRISVYQDETGVHIGYLRPEPMLTALSDDAGLAETAHEVEQALQAIVEAAR